MLHKQTQKAKTLNYGRLERLAKDKHSSLLGQFLEPDVGPEVLHQRRNVGLERKIDALQIRELAGRGDQPKREFNGNK